MGFGGAINLATHQQSKGCRTATAILQKGGTFPKKEERKNGSLVDMFARAKTKIKTTVRSTVTTPPPIRPVQFPAVSATASAARDTHHQMSTSHSSESVVVPSSTDSDLSESHGESKFPTLSNLGIAIARMPAEIPHAEDNAETAIYFGDPAKLVLPADDMWEKLDRMLNTTLQKEESELDALIKRGPKGIEALYHVLVFYVGSRGLNEQLLEGKIGRILAAIERV